MINSHNPSANYKITNRSISRAIKVAKILVVVDSNSNIIIASEAILNPAKTQNVKLI